MIKALKKSVVVILVFAIFFSFSEQSNAFAFPTTGKTAGEVVRQKIINPNIRIFLNDNLESNNAATDSKTLNDFIQSVVDGQEKVIKGVFVNDIFALPVIQQPSGKPAYVSSDENVITEFSLPRKHGVVGLLAHNYLAGKYFYEIETGDLIVIIYGDGRVEEFQVTSIKRYQALQPNSPHSDFINLETSEKLTATQLFKEVYSGDRHITLQTCIQEGNVDTWGRLFIIAEPIA